MHKYRLERCKQTDSDATADLAAWDAVSDEVDPVDISARDLDLQVMKPFSTVGHRGSMMVCLCTHDHVLKIALFRISSIVLGCCDMHRCSLHSVYSCHHCAEMITHC